MNDTKLITVIVPDKKGKDAMEKIQGINAILVESGKPVVSDALNAEVLVVGPAEQQSEVEDALRQIKQLPHLKLLQTLGQGIEQWDGLLPNDLIISTARGAHGGSTAELVLASLLAIMRELPHYIKNQQSRIWEGRRARTLQNANVLVYGSGDLGLNIKSRMLPFGAKVTMVGAHNHEDVIDTAKARTLLPTTDVVILALPLTRDTRHTVDTDFLALLRDGTIVINAGRGGLVDQAALLKELQDGRLQAALDVTTPEPLEFDSPLWDAPGLLITPHVGGNTVGADDRAWEMAVSQIQAYVRGDLSYS
ncbi:MAG: NAD(P)-dependent oxidoreductase [Candidatus Saccharimonadales bacterium]